MLVVVRTPKVPKHLLHAVGGILAGGIDVLTSGAAAGLLQVPP